MLQQKQCWQKGDEKSIVTEKSWRQQSVGRQPFLKASVTFSSDNKKFKRTPKSDKVLGDQTKKL